MENNIISLGINLGSSKTLYSISFKRDTDFTTRVLLMNNDSRVIPSLICYTSQQRLIGDNCKNSISQNLNTSYNSFSRFLGFEKTEKYKPELNFMYMKVKDINKFDFKCYNEKGELINIKSQFIIADYLSIINEYFFEKEKIKYTLTCLSLPDFYDDNEKKELKLICESIGMKNVEIYDESLAITMYYGYNNYSEFFLLNNGENTEKNILFIDIGYSKSLFILSNYKYNEFCVLKEVNIPHFGGRDFDLILFKYCINEFKRNNNNIVITEKMKYRLLVEIQKKRINLTLNDEILIHVDNIFEDIDLNINILKNVFEGLIKKKIALIENPFNQIIIYSKENKININCVEIAGDLMRTPILQKMIEEKNLKISKTILIDECTSIGASLLGNFYSGNFPYKDLKKVYIKKEKIKNYDNYSLKDIQLKEEIINHIQKEQIMDLNFDCAITKKIELSKLINNIKKKIENKNDELIEINKNIRKIDLHENYLDEIYNSLIQYLEKMKIKEQFNELIGQYENSINNIKNKKENIIKEIEFKNKKKHLLINIEKKNIELKKEIEISKNIIDFFDEYIKYESQIEIIFNKLESLYNYMKESNKTNIQEIIKKMKKLIEIKSK